MRYFEIICGTNLLRSGAVYDDYPDFTFCFHYSIIAWAPCLLLWFASPFWLFKIRKETGYKIDTSWLTLCKTISVMGLILIQVFDLASVLSMPQHRSSIYYLTPTLMIFTYSLVLFFVHYELKNGWRNSALLFVFWLVSVLASAITLRSKVTYHLNKNDEAYVNTTLKTQYANNSNYSENHLNLMKQSDFELFSFYVHYALLFLNFIWATVSEKVTLKTKAPEVKSSIVSKLLFWWVNRIISVGYKRELKREDLFEVDEKERVARNLKKLEDIWIPQVTEYLDKVKEIEDQEIVKDCGEEHETLKSEGDKTVRSKLKERLKKLPQPSLAFCLFKIYIFQFIGVVAMISVNATLIFGKPLVLDKLITFIMDQEQNLSVGLFYVFLLFLLSITSTIITTHFFHNTLMMGNRMKTSIMQLVFKKSLQLSTTARKTTTIGEMTTLITTNAETFDFSLLHLVGLLVLPYRLSINIYLLCRYIGVVATLAGVVTIIVFIPLNVLFTKKSRVIKMEKYKMQDSRIKTMNEILNGVRVIKFYGWEKSFEILIQKIRSKELKSLIKSGILTALSTLTITCSPIVIATISFAVFFLINKNSDLDPNTTFVALSLFNMLRFPLMLLPLNIQGLIQLSVSLARIRAFLIKDEIDDKAVSHENSSEYSIQVEDANFGWNKSESTLKNINLKVKKGQLVAVIGKVGSGKSSLISALLGEMHKLNCGKINVAGKTSYVPQQAWIKNETLKNNIIFNKTKLPMSIDEDFYAQVIENCQLLTDLDIMAAGDQTEIGEKGINLSGGQKQRISLARSVYADTDIYMLDDPLSAVDAHVGKSLFDLVLGPKGMLKNKTRILVTNSLNHLPEVDQIVLLESGAIIETGTYDQLKSKKKSAFNEFIKSFFEKTDTTTTEKDGLKNVQDKKEKNLNRSVSIKATKKGSMTGPEEETSPEKAPLLAAPKSINKKSSGAKLIEREKVELGNVKLVVIQEYFRACRFWVSLIFLFLTVLSFAFEMASNYWLSRWSNSVQQNKETINTLSSKITNLAIYSILGFSRSLIAFIASLFFIAMLVTSSKTLHNKLLDSILHSTLRFFESTPTGRILNRFTKDVEACEEAIPTSFQSLLDCFLALTSTLIIISSSTPYFIIFLVPIGFLYILLQRYFIPSNRQLKRLQSASKSPIFSHFSETQVGVSTIRAYSGQEWTIEAMEDKINEYIVNYYCNIVSNRWLAIRLEMIGNLITASAAIFAIFAKSNLSAGLAGLSISISLTISESLNMFVRHLSEFEANITSVERIKEYFEIKHEADWSIENTKPAKQWPEAGNVVLDKYSIKYREDLENVLSDVSIRIAPGEKIGIVGRTGAGKSSLTLGLFRMLEHTTGRIMIDGVDIGEIGLHDLRHKLTIIPQDPVIFSGTIRMNLDPFSTCSDEEIWKSLELSHLKEFVSGLERKLDFECSEGGDNLSVGQRQLICLARALLRKTKILVLDEATASIDHDTDDLIQRTIRTEFAQSTVLTIAHRLNTIMDSTRIIVLDKGRIGEFDSPNTLLSNKNGLFYSMAKNAGLVQ